MDKHTFIVTTSDGSFSHVGTHFLIDNPEGVLQIMDNEHLIAAYSKWSNILRQDQEDLE